MLVLGCGVIAHMSGRFSVLFVLYYYDETIISFYLLVLQLEYTHAYTTVRVVITSNIKQALYIYVLFIFNQIHVLSYIAFMKLWLPANQSFN